MSEDYEQRMGDVVKVETRSVEGVEKRYFTGTVLRFDDVGDIGGMFKERIFPGAFEYKKLRFNVMHERSKLLGRYPGNVLLTETDKEIRCEIEVLDTQEHRDAVTNIAAGVLRGWSVEFGVMPGGQRFVDGMREIHKAKLVGVALVDHPVYTSSTVAIRDALAAAEQEAARVKAAAKPRRFLV